MSSARLLAIAGAVVLAAACGSSSEQSSPSTTSTTATPAPSTTTSPAVTTTSVPVAPNRLTVYFVASEHMAAAGREVVAAATPEAAVRALLGGPQGAVEHDFGFTSAIPAGTALHSVTIAGNVATVDLSQQFSAGGGSLSMQQRVGQVVFTLTQFPSIEHVRFRIDGAPVTTIGGEGLMVDNVDRSTFANVTPFILVESPTPGQRVGSPLHARGMSNTFEATVNYTLTDPGGKVLQEGFTTARGGTGTWGTFSFDVPFTSAQSGIGHLVVYEISSRDGSHIHQTSLPIQLTQT